MKVGVEGPVPIGARERQGQGRDRDDASERHDVVTIAAAVEQDGTAAREA